MPARQYVPVKPTPRAVSPRDYAERLCEWLNGLGDDAAPFGGSSKVTNGEVRDNWTKANDFVRLASLTPSEN